MNPIYNYQNGNTNVRIYPDGTKLRQYEGVAEIDHPESIDVKITNYCDLGCAYCHETSTTKGLHADLDVLLSILSPLPAGVELAIGGGNPLSHPDLIPFLKELKTRGIIANLTVNQGHLKPYKDLILSLISDDLVKGIGISITSNNFTHIPPILEVSDNVVYHLIAGVNKVEVLEPLLAMGNCKVLLLGYKKFGLGIGFHTTSIDREISRWSKALPSLIGECVFSFDNLAIEQLNVRRLFTIEGWERFYMGDDFCFTMYIDAVNQMYAPTSRSDNRTSFASCDLLEYFTAN